MPVVTLSPIEDLDSRRELIRLFQLLTSDERIRFVEHVCKFLDAESDALKRSGVKLTVYSSTGDGEYSFMEAYLDVLQIVSQFGVEPVSMASELERWVKHLTKWPQESGGRLWTPDS